MWGEKRFRSKGMPCAARACRIRRARAVRGGDGRIPAHQRSPKQPSPSRLSSKGVKVTPESASVTGSASGISPIKARVRCRLSSVVKLPRTPLSYISFCASIKAAFIFSDRLIAIKSLTARSSRLLQPQLRQFRASAERLSPLPPAVKPVFGLALSPVLFQNRLLQDTCGSTIMKKTLLTGEAIQWEYYPPFTVSAKRAKRQT